MISGDLCSVEKERHGELRGEIGDVERMLKALIKSLESKHLDPWILDPWNPFSQLTLMSGAVTTKDENMD